MQVNPQQASVAGGQVHGVQGRPSVMQQLLPALQWCGIQEGRPVRLLAGLT